MRVSYLTASLAVFSATVLGGRSPQYQCLPSLQEQAQIQDGWRQERLAAIPALLHKHDVDAWLMSQEEYAEDTAFWSLKKAQQYSARRRTISLYFSNQVDCSAHTWIDITDDVWDDVKYVLEGCSPRSIVVNTDPQIAFASGLHAGEWDLIQTRLERKWVNRMMNKPEVAVDYMAMMPQSQLDWYRKLQETAWALIKEAFSERVITPGQTKTAWQDVEWWLREKLQALNYTTWFHPDVTVVLPSTDVPNNPPFIGKELIEYGDMLHVDFGVTALGLNTDTQHLAYVLPPGASEKDIPKGLLDGLKKAKQLQDIVHRTMRPGLTGNQILKYAKDEMHFQGMKGRVYSHPIGDWGHSAGTLIGMSNLQDGALSLAISSC